MSASIIAKHPVLAASAAMLFALAGSARAQTDSARARPAAADTAPAHVHVRVIGVFDEQSGAPLEGVDVTDMLTGLTTRTTKTGTAPLYFTDTTGALITMRKVGYQQRMLAVATSLADTQPVTTTLLPAGQVLAPVVVIGDRAVRLGKGDTISTLLANGFYERREIGAAPSSAFVSGDRLRGTMLVSDARFFGRGICESNVYVDGVHVVIPKRTGSFLGEGIDGMLDPSEIAGIETYFTGEMPPSVAHTIDADAGLGAAGVSNALTNASGTLTSAGCVSLIWLNR